MQYVHLGRTGLRVSRLVLGTMNFGVGSDEKTSFAMMDRALELGIQFFDTANNYGWKRGEGITEKLIGRWLAQGGGRRDRIVLASKCYCATGDGPNDGKLSAVHVRRACEDTLKRLRTDHLDLYQMHHIDRATSWEEVWQAMEQLVREGKVIYVGSSNFAAWHIACANAAAERRHFLGLVSEQSVYNLCVRAVELEVLPAVRALGLGFVAYSPLASGLLAGGVRGAKAGRRANEGIQKEAHRKRVQIQRWENLCRRLGEKPADVALAWLLHQPGVTGPIIGPRTLAQLEGNLKALEIQLSPAVLARLDRIFPPIGIGGAAPEAYAW